MNWISRTIEPRFRRALTEAPVVAVVGPREAGKTALLRRVLAASHRYCPLDDPTVRRIAREDPGLLLERFPPPVILDEFQLVPELIPMLRARIDSEMSPMGRYVIASSQLQPMGRLLANGFGLRIQILTLLSLSLKELTGQPEGDRVWRDILLPSADSPAPLPTPGPLPLARQILRGGFALPATAQPAEPGQEGDAFLWHSAYVQGLLERETHAFRSVRDLGHFERFVFALAARSGQLLNLEDLAREIGVTGKTARSWIELLEGAGQVVGVHPLEADVGKRLVRRSRVYFLDTGTLALLLNASQADQVLSGIASAPLFRTAVAGQLARLLCHRGHSPRLYFWETAAGHRVDFILGDGQQLIPIDTSLNSTPTADDARRIRIFQDLLGSHVTRGIVICPTRRRVELTPTVDAVPLGAL